MGASRVFILRKMPGRYVGTYRGTVRQYRRPGHFAAQARVAEQAVKAIQRAYRAYRGGVKRRRDSVPKAVKKKPVVRTGKLPKGTYTYAGGPVRFARRKRFRKPTVSRALRKGYEIGIEYRNELTDQNIISLMGGTPMYRYIIAMWAAAYRELLFRGGHELDDWSSAPKFTDTIFRVKYRQDMNTANIQNIDTAVSTTHIQTVTDIVTNILNNGNVTQEAIFIEFVAYQNVGTAQRTMDASVMMTNYKVTVYDRHVLMIQNRTAGATASDTSMEDVTNNPLTYRCWNLRGNGARCSLENFGTGVAESIAVEPVTGIREGTNIAGGVEKKIAIPGAFYNAKGTYRSTLMPGAIKKCSFNNSTTDWFNKMWFKFGGYIEAATGAVPGDVTSYSKLGSSRLFQFEKLCQVQADVSSLDVTVGYEHNMVIGAYMTKARLSVCRRLEEVN